MEDEFKEIDKGNAFRGIVFGTPLLTIKKAHLLEQNTYNHDLYYVSDEYFKQWKGIFFDDVGLGFNLQKKFRAVLMCQYNKEEGDFKELLFKLTRIFGKCSIENNNGEDYYKWYGKKLSISLNYTNDKSIEVFISSLLVEKTNEPDC